jgi:pilus assembly protein CpaE
VLSVQGLAGGVGATTFAVNLAWELATVVKQDPPLVCLLDFDLQFGSVATYLDLPRKEAIFEMWSNTATLDTEAFRAGLLPFKEKLHVLTAPADMLPLDLVTGEDVARVLEMARHQFDFVIVDLPSTVVSWTETVLTQSQLCFALLELDMRSAQNALRLIRALKAEDLPVDKLRYGLNRAPGLTELSAKSRAKRLAESLGIRLELMLPDGQRQVTDANDHGLPISESAPRNPLRKEIQKLAKSLYDLDQTAIAAAR